MTNLQAPLELLPRDAPEWNILEGALENLLWYLYDEGLDSKHVEALLRAAVTVCPRISNAIEDGIFALNDILEFEVAATLRRILPEPNDDA